MNQATTSDDYTPKFMALEKWCYYDSKSDVTYRRAGNDGTGEWVVIDNKNNRRVVAHKLGKKHAAECADDLARQLLAVRAGKQDRVRGYMFEPLKYESEKRK